MKYVEPEKYLTKAKIKKRRLFSGGRRWNDNDINERLGAPDIMGTNTGEYVYSRDPVQIYLLAKVENAERKFIEQ